MPEKYEFYFLTSHLEILLKKWRRQWKIDLIQIRNVEWDDLYETL